jgi:hypothetical protein
MEAVSLVVQGCIGSTLTIYGSFSLLRYRGKRAQLTGKFVLGFACMLAGIILLGYVFGHGV